MRRFILFVLMIMLLSFRAGMAGNILIIVNESVPVDSLDAASIIDIYENRLVKWSNGDKIKVTMLKKGSTHEEFSRNILGITPVKLINIWKRALFTGMGAPPRILKKEAALVKFVSDNQGAIGYINTATPYSKVKVVAVR